MCEVHIETRMCKNINSKDSYFLKNIKLIFFSNPHKALMYINFVARKIYFNEHNNVIRGKTEV